MLVNGRNSHAAVTRDYGIIGAMGADANIVSEIDKIVHQQIKGAGERLRLVRLASGYESAAEFARNLGVEAAAYRRYERGESSPLPLVMGRIRQLTGATSDYINYGDDTALPVGLYRAILERTPAT